MNLSFLQTNKWADFQKSLGRNVFICELDETERYFLYGYDFPISRKKYLYAPFPFISDELVESMAMRLRQMAKERQTVFVKLEPINNSIAETLLKSGFVRSKKAIQPQLTQIIDLTKNDQILLNEMAAKTSYNIRLAEKKNLMVEPAGSLEEFWELTHKTSARDKFSSHDLNYFKKFFTLFINGDHGKADPFAKLWIVRHDSIPLAAAVVIYNSGTAHYLFGASDHKYRSFMAPHLMHWNIIKDAKLLGFERYDLWGIDSEKWPGITRFKKSFGGYEHQYPGSFDLPISGFWYFAYNLVRGGY